MSNNSNIDVNNIRTSATADNPFGKILASGNGKGNSYIPLLWTVTLTVVVVLVGLLTFMSNNVQDNIREANTVRLPGMFGSQGTTFHTSGYQKANEAGTFFLWLGIIGIFFLVFNAVCSTIAIAQTEVTIYENGITGVSVGTIEWHFYQRRFQIAYDKVASTDVNSRTITIRTSDARYKCYVKNSSEIQGIIVSQQHKQRSVS